MRSLRDRCTLYANTDLFGRSCLYASGRGRPPRLTLLAIGLHFLKGGGDSDTGAPFCHFSSHGSFNGLVTRPTDQYLLDGYTVSWKESFSHKQAADPLADKVRWPTQAFQMRALAVERASRQLRAPIDERAAWNRPKAARTFHSTSRKSAWILRGLVA